MKLFSLYKIIPLFFLSLVISRSQNFNVSEVDASLYPKVVANFSAFNAQGNPYLNLTTNDFEVRENGVLLPPELVELICSTDAPYNVVIVVDRSTSMTEKVDGQLKWDWAREGVTTFVNNIPLGDSSKMALTAFSGKADLLCPFTGVRQEVLDSLAKIPEIYGNTNFNVAFLDQTYGAIELLKVQSPYYKRAIVFLTDGEHSGTTEVLRYNEILQQLQDYNIQLFSVTLLSGKNQDLENLSKKTGGYYDFVDTKTKLNNLYKAFAESLQFRQQCLLQWLSPEICDDNGTFREVSIKFKIQDKTIVKGYKAPYSSIVYIESENDSYDFDNPNLGSHIDRDIIITPRLRSVTTKDIRVVPPGHFEIIDWGDGIGNQPSYDFIMPVDVPRKITVRFTPQDVKKFRQATLVIDGLPCPKEIPLVGGLHKIKITKPATGDYFTVCDSIDIEWTGVEPTTEVNLFYSDNDGYSWNLIVQNFKGNKVKWLAPKPGDKYRFRAQVAPVYNYDAANSYGGPNEDIATSISVQQNGLYTFVSGYFNNSIKINTKEIISKGKEDFFLAKFDTDGNFIWGTGGGTTTFNDRAYGVTVDHLGYSYITGITYKGIIFEGSAPILPFDNTPYLFVAKFNPQGQFVNSRFLGAVSDFQDFKAQGRKIAFEYKMGDIPKIYVEGLYTGQYLDYVLDVDLPDEPSQKPFTAIFNTSLDLIGLYPGTLSVNGYSDTVYNYNNEIEYRVGNFTGTKKIDKFTLSSNGLNDFWISKYAKLPMTIDITGTIAFVKQGPALTVGLYNFGDVVYGDSVDAVLVKRIYNEYKIPVKITSYLFDAIAGSDNKNDYTLTEDIIGMVIPPGDSVDLKIRFKPGYTGPRDAWLQIFCECGDPVRLDLKGNGVCGGTSIDLYDFGDQNLNKPRTDTIKCAFSNLSNVKVNISPQVRGANFGDFILKIPDYYNVYAGKVTVNPGECIDLIVTFTPKALGPRESMINYFVDLPCKNSFTTLKGNGITSDVNISSYNWNERRVNAVYNSTILIKNNSIGTEQIDSIKFESLPEDNSFTFTFDISTLPRKVKANEDIEVPVNFSPVNEKKYQSRILCYIASRVDPLISTLEGTGILPKLITDWHCGEDVKTGDSTTAFLMLYNPSSSSVLNIKNIDFETQMPQYSWLTPNNPQDVIINKEDSLIIPVKYKPQTGNNLNTILILADNYDGTFTEEWKLNKVTTDCDGITITSTPVEFNNQIICTENTYETTIKNGSKDIDVELFLSNADILPNQSNEYQLLDDKNIIIKGGGEANIRIMFKPEVNQEYISYLNIPNSANYDLKIKLSGTGKTISHKTTNNDIKIKTGDKFDFPVFTTITPLENGSLKKLNLLLQYNPFMIQFVEGSLSSTLPNWNWSAPVYEGNGKLKLSGQGAITHNNTVEIFKLTFSSLLNDIHKSEIKIQTDYGCEVINEDLAVIETEKVCFNDNRIVLQESAGRFMIGDISPNPVSTSAEINFGVGFEVFTNIQVFNSFGERIMTISNEVLPAGYYKANIDTKELSSGVYYIVMSSGPYAETKKLIISK